ncbi:uncharacterized protein TNCV_4048381 [Trichonephila clavipes]|nr:uncharacterized protein TNCV_4048381 [Trichonephila clavipes]
MEERLTRGGLKANLCSIRMAVNWKDCYRLGIVWCEESLRVVKSLRSVSDGNHCNYLSGFVEEQYIGLPLRFPMDMIQSPLLPSFSVRRHPCRLQTVCLGSTIPDDVIMIEENERLNYLADYVTPSSRKTSRVVGRRGREVGGPIYPPGVLPQNRGGNEPNRTVTCMMLKATANDRRHLALCHDEFRGPRSGLCRSGGISNNNKF